ncbi:MAG: EAL domain-containing protein [Burkholderiaceae bacterium]|nr:EAL domain-containing protein [Burkholderiaceae bacterium]
MSVSQHILVPYSLGIDLLSCSVLFFLWLRHRDEKHALYWAIGQCCMAAVTSALSQVLPAALQQVAAALFLTLSVVAFWAGTEAFLGQLNHVQWRRAVLCGVLGGALMWLAREVWDDWRAHFTAVTYGVTFLWIGYRLAGKTRLTRVLAGICLVRGAFNVANGLMLVPAAYEGWIIFALLVKGASLLCLIAAVQDKIERRYLSAIDSLSNGFVVLDRDGVIHTSNQGFAHMLGVADIKQLIGTVVTRWQPDLAQSRLRAHFRRFAVAATYPYVETAVVRRADGSAMPVELIASPHQENGQLFCMMLVIDITERKKRDDALYRAAHYDSTTGVYNRHGLSQQLRACLRVAERDARQCAVLFIDIDKFQRVNDSFGHAVGDQLLNQLAQRLQHCLGQEHVLGRVGADEFVVVLPSLPADTAQELAAACGQRILTALSHSFDLAPHAITIAVSIGVACAPGDGGDGDTLVCNADIAMHQVKKASRSNLGFFSPAMNSYSRDALVIDAALRSALTINELRLVYQPIVDAQNGRLEKVEALLRWNSATLGVVGPDRFIPVAEESDLIIDLGTWVLNEACRQLRAWQTCLPLLTISINVSARQLLDAAFLDLVGQALAVNQLLPHQLELEITERVLISEIGQVGAVLDRLRTLGVRISLDDFGTGYSSLSYLTQFQMHTLKIDRSFVSRMVDSQRSKALVETIIAMGHSLGLKLVAEGVENAEQARTLASMGCQYLQGYHISPPVSSDDLVWLSLAASAPGYDQVVE